jgi:hypothetical protein
MDQLMGLNERFLLQEVYRGESHQNCSLLLGRHWRNFYLAILQRFLNV